MHDTLGDKNINLTVTLTEEKDRVVTRHVSRSRVVTRFTCVSSVPCPRTCPVAVHCATAHFLPTHVRGGMPALIRSPRYRSLAKHCAWAFHRTVLYWVRHGLCSWWTTVLSALSEFIIFSIQYSVLYGKCWVDTTQTILYLYGRQTEFKIIMKWLMQIFLRSITVA